MNVKEAVELTNKIKPKVVIPVHYNSIVGTQKDGEEFKKSLAKDINCRIML